MSFKLPKLFHVIFEASKCKKEWTMFLINCKLPVLDIYRFSPLTTSLLKFLTTRKLNKAVCPSQ